MVLAGFLAGVSFLFFLVLFLYFLFLFFSFLFLGFLFSFSSSFSFLFSFSFSFLGFLFFSFSVSSCWFWGRCSVVFLFFSLVGFVGFPCSWVCVVLSGGGRGFVLFLGSGFCLWSSFGFFGGCVSSRGWPLFPCLFFLPFLWVSFSFPGLFVSGFFSFLFCFRGLFFRGFFSFRVFFFLVLCGSWFCLLSRSVSVLFLLLFLFFLWFVVFPFCSFLFFSVLSFSFLFFFFFFSLFFFFPFSSLFFIFRFPCSLQLIFHCRLIIVIKVLYKQYRVILTETYR